MNLNIFFQELDTLFRTNQIDRVEPFLLEQMVVANQEHDKNASLAIINELIGFYRSQGRHTESVRVSEQALNLCRDEYILGSVSHATTLLNAATAYRFAGQSQKAMELFEQTEQIYQEKVPLNDDRYAGLLNNMSAACADLGQLDKAAEYLLRAAAIMDAHPAHAIDSGVTHANLAALYFKMQNYYGAKSHIAIACNYLKDRPEAASKYEQFKAMQELFDKLPG